MKSILLAFVALLFFSDLLSQSKPNVIEIIQDIDSVKTRSGDTLQIKFRNNTQNALTYSFDVQIVPDTCWCYKDSTNLCWCENPFYTRYYNHQLSYKKMEDMFSHGHQVIPSKYWEAKFYEIKSGEVSRIFFLIKKKESGVVARLRINFYSEDSVVGETSLYQILSLPFPLVEIRE